MKEHKINYKIIRYGQVKPYGDSVSEFEIETDLPEHQVRDFCTKFLSRGMNDLDKKPSSKASFNGTCGFPFGLESFYRFKKMEDNKYSYICCRPYCD